MPISTSLLLLPSPPSEITLESISIAYYSSLTLSFSALRQNAVSTKILVALDWPVLQGQLLASRAKLYDDALKLLGRLYVLIYSVCDKLFLDVNSGLPGSVDPSLVLLDCSDPDSVSISGLNSVSIFGPFFDLQSLARASFKWHKILSTNDSAGQELLAKYHYFKQQEGLHPKCYEAELSLSGMCTSIEQKIKPCTTHKVVAVGGTFDHLHAGHKLLLTATALLLQPSASTSSNLRLIVGITGDELLKNKKYPEYMKSWRQRQEDVVNFLLSILLLTFEAPEISVLSPTSRQPGSNFSAVYTKIESFPITIECIELKDPFGPTITDEDITALVVSRETRSGGISINQKRVENGIRPLKVYEIEVLSAEDIQSDSAENFATKISSSEIRKRRAEKCSSLIG